MGVLPISDAHAYSQGTTWENQNLSENLPKTWVFIINKIRISMGGIDELPSEMVQCIGSWLSVDDLALATTLNQQWHQCLQKMYWKRSVQSRLLRFTTRRCLSTQIAALYLRPLSPGMYRCRNYDSPYDHLLLALDTYKSFMREYTDTEGGMFELGVVHSQDNVMVGMVSFDRFMN